MYIFITALLQDLEFRDDPSSDTLAFLVTCSSPSGCGTVQVRAVVQQPQIGMFVIGPIKGRAAGVHTYLSLIHI